MTPGGEEGSGPAGMPAGGRYVVTTDQQRREWGLPDLANGPGGDAAAPGDPAAMERAGAVSVVDSADALDLLFEDGASRSGAAALGDGAGGDVAATLVDGAGGDVRAEAPGRGDGRGVRRSDGGGRRHRRCAGQRRNRRRQKDLGERRRGTGNANRPPGDS